MSEKRAAQARLWQILGVLVGFGVLAFVIINLRLYAVWWPEWNLFLALVPLAVSTLICYLVDRSAAPASLATGSQTGSTESDPTESDPVQRAIAATPAGRTGPTAHQAVKVTLLVIVWFLFLPNAFYYLTDLLYLAPLGKSIVGIHPFRPENLTAIRLWIPVLFIAAGAFISVLAGILSVQDLHRLLRLRTRLAAWQRAGLLGLLFLLNGLGIYLGRFARLNSWDVLRPWKLVSETIDSLNLFALEFSLVMTVCIAVIYTAACLLAPVQTGRRK